MIIRKKEAALYLRFFVFCILTRSTRALKSNVDLYIYDKYYIYYIYVVINCSVYKIYNIIILNDAVKFKNKNKIKIKVKR